MTLRFLHSSDWHLGRPYRRLGPRSAEARSWRFDAVHRLFELAARDRADFLLVAGDVFDSDLPSDDLVAETVALLRDTPVPTIVIPGNHDPATQASVWMRASFAGPLRGHPRLHVALVPEPIHFAELSTTVFPCPVTAKHTPNDLSAWIPPAPRGETYRIGLAHGIWQGYDGQEHFENYLAADRADRAGLDYFALGDLHSYTLPEHPAARRRSYYSGTTECLACDEERPGHVLRVEIAAPGAEPAVTPLRVGRIRPARLPRVTLSPGGGLAALESAVDAIGHPEHTLLGVDVEGALTEDEMAAFDAWANRLLERFLLVDLDRRGLVLEPSEDDWNDLDLDGVEQRVLQQLRDPALADTFADDHDVLPRLAARADIRREAMALFYRLVKEASAS